MDDQPEVEIVNVPLELSAEEFPSGMNAALSRWDVQPIRVPMSFARPKSLLVPINKKPRVKVYSLKFSLNEACAGILRPPKDETEKPNEKKPTLTIENGEPPPTEPEPAVEGFKKPEKYTRIKPPGDIVKLEDRLHFVLQPPLEVISANEHVVFPFNPFPYQLEGIAFLYPRTAALLADEMGLGKTMQTISTIRLMLRSGEARKILLVCPKPLVFNWIREFALWAPEVPVMAIEGDGPKRRWQWQLNEVPVKLANYELLQRDKELVLATDPRFDLVVLDEAQRIKNTSSTTAEIVCALPRRRSWALSGTPVENCTQDLVGIFQYLAPGYLQPDMKPRRLAELSSEYILRRTKDMVLTEMPPKMFRDEQIELTPQQFETYDNAEKNGIVKLNELGAEMTVEHVFELVMRLKQICNFDPVTGASAKADRLVAELEEIAASGQQALVFSQYVSSLDKLLPRVKHFKPLEYHGRIPHKQRPGIIDKFKADKSHKVLLMSYGAGSVGLNLQFCTYVFLFDRWWNPAIEDQAINRAHRIGAAGPVTVTRFITPATIEQRIDAVLSDKRDLFNEIFNNDHPPRKLGFTRRDLFGLFNLRTPQGPIVDAA
jgi:SNF2 family DNA or RNA helicase